MDFFEETRAKGEEAFGEGADNLTGVVAVFHHPSAAPKAATVPPPSRSAPTRALPGMPPSPKERDLGGDLGV